MESFTIEQAILNDQVVNINITKEGMLVTSSTNENFIEKNEIKNVELFRSVRKYCLRIITEKTCYDAINIDDSTHNSIKQCCSSFYGINITNMNLEILNTTEGNLQFNNNILTFNSSKPVFSIPKNSITKIVEFEKEMQVHLGDLEIVLSTTSNVTDFLKNKVSEDIGAILNVNCIYPRSKSTLIFYNTYFECRGSSYDHTISYSNVKDFKYVHTEKDIYLLVKLDTSILQGQTKYENLVFSLETKDIEVAAKDDRLKDYYKGPHNEVVVEIMEELLGKKVEHSDFYTRCTNKINDGYLCFMKDSVEFLPKPVSIFTQDIILVEFSRISLSTLQAKTFDMTIHSDKAYLFNSINKDNFSNIEGYFSSRGIKMTSEVLDDEVSAISNDESDEGSDISDIIANSEE